MNIGFLSDIGIMILIDRSSSRYASISIFIPCQQDICRWHSIFLLGMARRVHKIIYVSISEEKLNTIPSQQDICR
jgi:hypothetical protein